MVSSRDCREKIEKQWGTEFVLANGPRYCMKVLWIRPGHASSLHRHLQKDETFLCVFGACYLQVGKTVRRLAVGMAAQVPHGTWHRFWVPPDTEGQCGVVEASSQHFESDVDRRSKSRSISRKQHEEWKAASDVPVS